MKTIIQTFKKYKKFLISTHVNPDPDALCSEAALALFLRSQGKEVTILNEEKVPERFSFLPHIDQIKNCSQVKNIDYDVAVILDCGDLDRIGKVKESLGQDKIIINIDHHIINSRFGDLNLVHPRASSTAEVLFELLMALKARLTRDMALHLYTGIMTDTGSFRYENTTPRTHEIVGTLLRYRFSPSELYKRLYEMIPFGDLKEFTNLFKRMDLFFHGKVVCVMLPQKTVKKFSEEFDLRDTIFKFLRSIKGVEVHVILTGFTSRKTRVNLRSTGRVNVAKLAHLFKGGGHRRASGCVLGLNLHQAKEKILRTVRTML